MKLILFDRILLFLICCFLGVIAGRMLVGYPVQAAKEEIIDVNIVRINGLRFLNALPVNITKVGGERCRLSDFK